MSEENLDLAPIASFFVGKGTPGSRFKSAWRKAGRPHKSLKRAAYEAASNGDADALEWLKAKRS